jgi:hypothetical protein
LPNGPEVPPPPGGGPLELRSLVFQARNLLDVMGAPRPNSAMPHKYPLMATKSANVPAVRDDLIDTLTHALSETNKLGQKAAVQAEKGAGGMPEKARWYQLLGYLAQVLDGVCRNVELSEINERLAKVEGKLGNAPSRSA